MYACRRGHLETAKVLLENGANVDKPKEVRKRMQRCPTSRLYVLVIAGQCSSFAHSLL